MAALPYKDSRSSKKRQVEEMFDNISPKYDLLNHILSVNIDKIWRKRAIKLLHSHKPKLLLDVATGTGDFAIAASKKLSCKVVGIDISEGMLKIGNKKLEEKQLNQQIKLQKADLKTLKKD